MTATAKSKEHAAAIAEARAAYLDLVTLPLPHDCGHTLALFVSPTYAAEYHKRAARRDKAFRALKAIDPDFPWEDKES